MRGPKFPCVCARTDAPVLKLAPDSHNLKYQSTNMNIALSRYQVRNRNDLTPKSTFLQKNQDQLNELDNFNPELVSKQSCERRGKYDHLKM